MKITKIYYIIMITFCLHACKDPVMEIPPVETGGYDGKLELIWQTPLSNPSTLADTVQYISMPAIINSIGTGVIFSRYTPLAPSPDGDEIIFALDANSGSAIWENTSPPWSNWGSGTFLRNGTILHNSYHDVHAINELTGDIVWSYFIDRTDGNGGNPNFNVIDDEIYHIHVKSPSQRPDEGHLVKSETTNGLVWDTLYSSYALNECYPNVKVPSKWRGHPSGDEILVFQDRTYCLEGQTTKVNLVALNVTADSILWRLDDLDGNSNPIPPLVYDDKVYIMLNHSVLCVDMLTGDEVWRKDNFDNNEWLVVSSIIAAEGMIIVHPSQKKMYALDPETGSEIWVNSDTGETPSEMTYHAGIVYYSSNGDGRLYAIRVSDGETIWAEKSPNNHKDSRAIFKNKVAIHPDLGVLYISDSFFAMSIRLPE